VKEFDPPHTPPVDEGSDRQSAVETVAPSDRVLLQIRETTVIRVLSWVRRALGWLTYGYVTLVAVLLLALEWWGERNWLLSVFLYAPPQIILVPLFILSPLCLAFRWRMLGWHIGTIVLLFFGYMSFRWSSVPPPTAESVSAVTFNFGESSRSQFMGFIENEKPDLIILQDARGRAADLLRKIPGMHASGIGQFVLLSRFPIRQGTLVGNPKIISHAVAARWEVTIQGRDVAIYGVHLPTPRRELSRFIGKRRVIAGLIGYGDRETGFGEYREWIAERIVLAEMLARIFAEEQSPMIVAGDFNTPDHGHIYRLFAAQMTDAFAHAGRGWGLTFPGSTRNPLTLFGPWLRIDYFFSGRGWEPVECRPERGKKSQHKAVFARFEPRPLP